MPVHEFQDREERRFELVKPGDYIVGIETAKLTISKAKGDEQVEIVCKPIASFGGTTLHEIKDAGSVWWYGGFNDKRCWGLDVFLKALRKQPKKGEKLDISDEWLAVNAAGALAWATIGEDEYNGRKKNTLVRWIVTQDALHPDPHKFFNGKPNAAGETSTF